MHNIYRYILNILIILSLAGSGLLLPSCVKDGADKYKRDGGVLIELQSRSGEPDEDEGYVVLDHEDKIKELHALFFTDDADKDFIEIVKAEQYGLNAAGTNPIYMVKAREGTYHMVLLANCGEVLADSGLGEADPEDGLTLEDFRMMLTMHVFGFTDYKWITDPQDPEFIYMPMWGENEHVTVTSGGADLTGPNLVPMVRMLARIDIVLGTDGNSQSVASRYDLHSVRFYNWRTVGQVIPEEGAVDFDYTSGQWDYTVHQPSVPELGTRNTVPLIYGISPAVTQYRASIYTFENEKPDSSDPDIVYEPMEYPCLVLGISEKGKGTTRGYGDIGILYYRIDFIDNNGDWLDILRNHKYTFTVTDIVNRGFPDPDQAHRSWVYDLDYKMEWEPAFDQDMASGGGTYRLDISQTYFDVSTYSLSFTVSTTHPDGWSTYPSAYPDRIEPTQYFSIVAAEDPRFWDELDYQYIHLPDVYGNIEDIPPDVTFTVTAEIRNPGWNGSWPAGEPIIAEEYIHIVSGNLTNVITVRITGWPQF